MGGVVWLVRNNQNYVNQSLALEDAAALQTVQLQYFADVISGRTAIGHDREGRVVIGQVNGKTEKRGFVKYHEHRPYIPCALNAQPTFIVKI